MRRRGGLAASTSEHTHTWRDGSLQLPPPPVPKRSRATDSPQDRRSNRFPWSIFLTSPRSRIRPVNRGKSLRERVQNGQKAPARVGNSRRGHTERNAWRPREGRLEPPSE